MSRIVQFELGCGPAEPWFGQQFFGRRKMTACSGALFATISRSIP